MSIGCALTEFVDGAVLNPLAGGSYHSIARR